MMRKIRRQPPKPAEEHIPVIRMDEVPLRDAIKALTKQASLTYRLDPSVNLFTPTGKEITVSVRWDKYHSDPALKGNPGQ